MIRAIVALGKWLDARFPAKVVVTQSEYDGLKKWGDSLAKIVGQMQAENVEMENRVIKLEQSIAAIKDAMTKAPTMAAQVRADYIRSGRMPE